MTSQPMFFATPLEAKSISATEYLFPPLLSFQERIGLWSGFSTPQVSLYDGLIVFQTGLSGQNFMGVQSGMWKTFSLS